MNKDLAQATEAWKKLERKTVKQRQIAEEYYSKHLMKLIEEEFIEHNQEKVYEEVECLIMSVGTLYEPLSLSIQLLKPKKILFLYTEQTETILNKIVKYCRLNISNIYKSRVNETEPTDIYREIKKAYLDWNKPQKLYIDFTGGTKAMSVAAAMAGSFIKVRLIYVGTNDYLVDFRKPNPGSETLYYISNPIEIFGDMEIEKAFTLFSQYNYSGVCEKLELIKEQVPDPNIRQQLNFVYLLARSYECWDALEFKKAYDYMCTLNREISRDKNLHKKFILMDLDDILEKQQYVLESMLIIPKMVKEKN